MDAINDKVMTRIATVLDANQSADVIVPFSKYLLDQIDEKFNINKYSISLLTEVTINRGLHPLLFVDESDESQDMLKKYHFALSNGTIVFDVMNKMEVMEKWGEDPISGKSFQYLKDCDEEEEIFLWHFIP